MENSRRRLDRVRKADDGGRSMEMRTGPRVITERADPLQRFDGYEQTVSGMYDGVTTVCNRAGRAEQLSVDGNGLSDIAPDHPF